MPSEHTALKYDAVVTEAGRVELALPFPAGTRVVVFVIEQPDDASDHLIAAAGTSLGFWDNTADDADWNNA
jgi:hypothetical protein